VSACGEAEYRGGTIPDLIDTSEYIGIEPEPEPSELSRTW
jgi:hypothetical protein